MKARLPAQYDLSPRRVRREEQRTHERAMAIFFLHTACALHVRFKFGKQRIEQFLQCVYELLERFNELYEEAAVWKCIEILEDIGLDMTGWKKLLRNGGR